MNHARCKTTLSLAFWDSWRKAHLPTSFPTLLGIPHVCSNDRSWKTKMDPLWSNPVNYTQTVYEFVRPARFTNLSTGVGISWVRINQWVRFIKPREPFKNLWVRFIKMRGWIADLWPWIWWSFFFFSFRWLPSLYTREKNKLFFLGWNLCTDRQQFVSTLYTDFKYGATTATL